jgi:hypothetical protein
MPESQAQTLAQEVLAEKYAPNTFEDCVSQMPLDANSHVVKLTQFLLFKRPTVGGLKPPGYAILPPLFFLTHPQDADFARHHHRLEDHRLSVDRRTTTAHVSADRDDTEYCAVTYWPHVSVDCPTRCRPSSRRPRPDAAVHNHAPQR